MPSHELTPEKAAQVSVTKYAIVLGISVFAVYRLLLGPFSIRLLVSASLVSIDWGICAAYMGRIRVRTPRWEVGVGGWRGVMRAGGLLAVVVTLFYAWSVVADGRSFRASGH